jgi:D-alanyl-D-alanine-carboxypeptidase/D-alanyl-D-alanine-endopeptidase
MKMTTVPGVYAAGDAAMPLHNATLASCRRCDGRRIAAPRHGCWTLDQLEFLAANLGLRAASPTTPALRAARVPRRPTGIPGVQIALGWHVLDADGDIFWHNGGTGGFQSFIGLDLQRQVGVVVLSNVAAEIGVDDIGVHLLRPDRALAPPRKWHVEVPGDPARYDGFVGRYQLTPELVAEFTREGDRLFTQLTGQPRAEVFPEGERDFFLKVAPLFSRAREKRARPKPPIIRRLEMRE